MMLGVLGMFAASCDEAPEAPKPQENAQEPIFAVGDITSATDGVLAADAQLNLEDYRESAGIPVMKLAEAKYLPEGAAVEYKVQLASDEDFAGKVLTLDTEAGENGVYTVDAEAWNDAHVALFGKSPKVKTVYYRVPVYVALDGTDYRYESTSYYAAEGSLEETCMDLGFVIENKYYLVGTINGWGLNTSAPAFEHSDADVYDDPVFTIAFKVDQADIDANSGWWWKVAPESSAAAVDWDALVGPETNGDTALSGHLVDTNAQAGVIDQPGSYKMTINMEAMTYNIEKLLRPTYAYTPGNCNGWSQLNSSWMQYFSGEIDGKARSLYYTMMPLDTNGFKVCLDTKWDNSTDYGAETDAPALTGNFVLGQYGKNIIVPEAGLYWMNANYDDDRGEFTTYELIKVEYVSLIGSFAASGWSADVEMTANEDLTVWTGEITLAEGDEWKVRINHGWLYSLGADGEDNTHTIFPGSNIKLGEAGTFTITLTLQPGAPTITWEKK